MVKTVTVAIRKLAQSNGRLFWSQIETDWWHRYATDTVPQIVLERSQIPERMARARKEKRA